MHTQFKNYIGILFLFLIIPQCGNGQERDEKEIEFTIEKGWESPEVFSLGEKGFLFVVRNTDGKKETWKMKKYDTNFEFQKELIIAVERVVFVENKIVDNHLYIYCLQVY